MFYKLTVKENARKAPTEVLGLPVAKDVSTYVETTRDLVAEADKKGLKTVSVTAVETVPERGEDGNAPRFFDLGDEGQNTEAPEADAPAKPEEDATDATDDELPKKQYKVLENELGGGVEYPRGTAHEPGTILELTDEDASLFAPGLIEPVENEQR